MKAVGLLLSENLFSKIFFNVFKKFAKADWNIKQSQTMQKELFVITDTIFETFLKKT